ncbi:MAG TPA: protein kinase [Pyrinomonadaceae bacterium]|nr:protein kinase [Pyrinomonadaceae bacterium]
MKSCPRCGREFQDTTTLCPADGTVLEKSGDELVGQMLTERYRIDERISEGGMGTVYRATHVLMDKRVAIKVLHPSLAADDKIVARFSREARAASRISHPHALNVTDFGESESGVVFLVMEFLDGRTLKDVIQSEGPMPLARAVEIIKQVAGALDAAHAEGVVHRDLKSDNIMLMEAAGGTDWAKVLDFGIAKIKENTGNTDPGLTAPNLIIGTPQYMSPEQCSQASAIDARSDIYSLGVIIYEMLTGHVPFAGESPTAIMMKHLQEPPPSVMEERDDLPPQVGMVITSALAKRPEDRFQSAGELSEALASAAIGNVPAPAISAATNPATSSSETNRIVVPTDSNEAPRHTREDELDEQTVISARPAAIAYETRAASTRAIEPPQKSSPWRIVIPALAGLLVLFGVIYAITYRGNPAQPDANQAPLTADPNSKPVQPAPPPTGNAEQGIAPANNSNTSNSNTSEGTGAANDSGAKPAENKNGEGAGAENANTGNANRKEQREPKNDNQGEQKTNEPPADNKGNEEEPPPPPKSNSNGDNQQEKPKPKKVEPNLPPPPPTSNISDERN